MPVPWSMFKFSNCVNIDIIELFIIIGKIFLKGNSLWKKENKFGVRSNIWIEDNTGKVAFGLGRLRILEAIERCGSMNAAAAELSMSYRSVWCRIRESENRIGRKLAVRKGKGSTLISFARDVMLRFRELDARLKEEVDEMFGTLL